MKPRRGFTAEMAEPLTADGGGSRDEAARCKDVGGISEALQVTSAVGGTPAKPWEHIHKGTVGCWM